MELTRHTDWKYVGGYNEGDSSEGGGQVWNSELQGVGCGGGVHVRASMNE